MDQPDRSLGRNFDHNGDMSKQVVYFSVVVGIICIVEEREIPWLWVSDDAVLSFGLLPHMARAAAGSRTDPFEDCDNKAATVFSMPRVRVLEKPDGGFGYTRSKVLL